MTRSTPDDRDRRELEHHLDALIRDGVAGGLSAVEARRRARLAFGTVDLAREACRDVRRGAWLADLGRDLRHALRLMHRAPGFTAFAIAALAGGVGANTAVFSVVHALLLAPLPVAQPQQLVVLSHGRLERGGGAGFPAGFVRELAASAPAVRGVVARGGMERVTIGIDGAGEPAIGELVSGGFFAVLGVAPAAGRLLTPADDRAGASPVVVLDHRYWQRRFDGDPGVVGRVLVVSGRPMTVVGVSPRGFDGLDPGQRVDLRAPLAMQAAVRGVPAAPAARREPWDLQVVARLPDGLAEPAARQAIDAAFQRFARAAGVADPGTIALDSAETGAGRTRARVAPILCVLLAMTLAVLGVACANLAMLVAARSATRRGEWAVRAALGAGTARLARQLVAEGLVLAGCGAAAGTVVAIAGASWLAALVGGGAVTFAATVRPHPAILAFHGGVALLAGLGLALGAVLRLRREEIAAGRQASSRTVIGGQHRGLIAGQVALSLIVLAGAALFVRTIQALRATDLGLQPDHLLLAALDPKTAGRADADVVPFFREVRQRLLATPGVTAVSFATVRSLANGRWADGVHVVGRTLDPSARALRNAVGPDYFRTLGIRVVAGREFLVSDDAAAPRVAVVNEAFAKTFLPGLAPIGQVVGAAPAAYTIVGVVGDARQVHVREPAAPTWFIPYEQRPGLKNLDVIVRGAGDPERLVGDLRRAVHAVDPRAALFEVRTQSRQIDEILAGERTLARLAGIFAAVAATIAALGLYGLLALIVAQRRREIGLRLALGATAWSVTATLAGDVGRSVLLGVAVGLLAAVLLGRQADALLFGVNGIDGPSLAGAAVAMVVAAAGGAAWPLIRATRIDPAGVLRV